MIHKDTMSLTELQRSGAERRADRVELFKPNDFYDHPSVLKQYSGLDPNFKLPSIILHGPSINDWVRDVEVIHPLTWLPPASKLHQEIYSHRCCKPSVVIGSPYYYASRMMEGRLGAIRKNAVGAIVFALHSTHHVAVGYDQLTFIQFLLELPRGYHTL